MSHNRIEGYGLQPVHKACKITRALAPEGMRGSSALILNTLKMDPNNETLH
jgi:hypothetical protein